VADVLDFEVLDLAFRRLQHRAGVGADRVALREDRDDLHALGPGRTVEAADEGGHGRHLPDALGEEGQRRQQAEHGPGVAVVRGAHRDERLHPAMSVEVLQVAAPDQAALAVADDHQLFPDIVALVEPLDFLGDQLGELGNGLGVEGVEDAAQVEAEDAEAVAAQPPLEHLEDATGAAVALQQQDGALERAEVGEPLDLVALEGEAEILHRAAGLAADLADVALQRLNIHLALR